jgi:hypothetical protein
MAPFKKTYVAVKDWYLRYERLISSGALVSGFIFDWLTLTRVDILIDDIRMVGNLVFAAIGVIFLNLLENRVRRVGQRSARSEKLHFWLIIGIQFFFGGLLSNFLVFYFRSATLATSWPFLLLLALFFTFNELLKHHYSRLIFQVTILFTSVFALLIFLIPVLIHQIGDWIFIVSGLASLVTIAGYVFLLRFISHEDFKKSRWLLVFSIFGMYALINVLYFTNIIPPLPLSLSDGGIYHSIGPTPDGNYVAEDEFKPWYHFFELRDTVHYVKGQKLYAFSAVFSPADLNTTIIHNWQFYNEQLKKWQSLSRVSLPIRGGRDDGFRTFSSKTAIMPGLWRVDIENARGQHIGRLTFTVIATTTAPITHQVILK